VVGEAADGHEAIELARARTPDLMLLDVSMPGMDGLEALPHIHEVSPDTAVVMFSGFEEKGLAEHAHDLGAAAFFEKSVSLDQLVERLLEVTGKRSGQSETTGAEVADGLIPEGSEVLDEHLERFREVFDAAAIGMAMMTLAGRLVRVNRTLASLVRRAEDELVGEQYLEVVADESHESIEAILVDIRNGPVDVAHLEHDIAAPGPRRRVRATFAPVRDSEGRALYLFMQLQDVTAEQMAMEELRRSEERFRLLVDAVEDYAIFMLDPGGHIVSWNAGAQRSKFYKAEEIIGQHFRVFYPPDKQEGKHPEFELGVALREGHYEEEGWRIRKDGSRFWANVLITAVFNAEGTHVGFAKVTRDTTERRRLEQEREAAVKALAQANSEMESLNERLQRSADDQAQFLAVTAHELRTPIGLLAGSAEMLSRHSEELTDEERKELLDSIGSGASRLRRLVGDLLTASRLQRSVLDLHAESVTVKDVVARALSTARASFPGTEVVVHGGEEDVTVETDRDRLAQMLENLFLNALRHGRSPVTVVLSQDEHDVKIHVTDSGRGVPENLRSRLFQRFATGPARGGTGLGLYIVRQLAQAQGGEATYEPPTPERPAGSFVLSLPRARVPSPGDV
jgi:PAS domain S-box-containing protein